MIVFELLCTAGHRFESWFQSGAAFERQQAENAIECPFCGARNVSKAPMAPHVSRAVSSHPAGGMASPAAPTARMLELLGRLRRQVEANCDYVGRAFPEEARRIHYGEAPTRNIYGEASAGDAASLKEEGIEAQHIPWLPRRDA